MMYHTKGRDIEQQYLLPVNIKEWLPEDDFSHIILDIVSVLDLSEVYSAYREDGQGAAFYQPEIMIGITLYSYVRGARSSREIERLCKYDVGYRIVSCNSYPDHTTISRFFQKHGSTLGNLFVQILHLMNEAGIVSNKVLALDGTKLKANASLGANMTYEKLEKAIATRINEILSKDAEEDLLYGPDRSGDEVPEGLRTRAERLRRFRAAKQRLDDEQKSQSDDAKERIQSREDKETETGRKKRGRKPKPPQETPAPETVANTTDPDSSIMKSGTSHIQGYNAQAFANQDGIILAPSVTNSAVDYNQLDPMIRELFVMAEQTGISLTNNLVLADAGYWSYQNYLVMVNQPLQFLCSTRHERDVFLIRGSPRTLLEIEDVCSKDCHPCPAVLAACGDWCSRHLLSETGIPSPAAVTRKIMETKMEPTSMKRKYSRRKAIIEPVFGWIKENRGMRKLQRRGLTHCDNEWKLICTTQNIRTVVKRGWWDKLKSAIIVKKNLVFDDGMGLLSGLIDLYPGNGSLHRISLTRFTLFEG
jgi:transposase